MVLLVSCANVASMLLAKSMNRQIGVRHTHCLGRIPQADSAPSSVGMRATWFIGQRTRCAIRTLGSRSHSKYYSRHLRTAECDTDRCTGFMVFRFLDIHYSSVVWITTGFHRRTDIHYGNVETRREITIRFTDP